MLKKQLKVPVDVLGFEMDPGKDERVSLSWHLTIKEKNTILKSWKTPHNQDVLKSLRELLK